MAAIKQIIVKCGSCSAEFPSPIFLGDTETFDSGTLFGNRVQCPKCRTMISCNKENMRYILADKHGGFVGNDYGKKD